LVYFDDVSLIWMHVHIFLSLFRNCCIQGRIQGGGGRTPSKIGKNMIFFGVRSWFFTRNTPKIFELDAIFLTWNPGFAPGIVTISEKWQKNMHVHSNEADVIKIHQNRVTIVLMSSILSKLYIKTKRFSRFKCPIWTNYFSPSTKEWRETYCFSRTFSSSNSICTQTTLFRLYPLI
jgi:hypothetical protein